MTLANSRWKSCISLVDGSGTTPLPASYLVKSYSMGSTAVAASKPAMIVYLSHCAGLCKRPGGSYPGRLQGVVRQDVSGAVMSTISTSSIGQIELASKEYMRLSAARR